MAYKIDLKQEHIQTMFDRLLDGKGAAMHDGACMYRTPDGLACVVGSILPNEVADEADTSDTVCMLVTRDIIEVDADDLNLLDKLQSLHDDVNNWQECTLQDEAKASFLWLIKDAGFSAPVEAVNA